MITHANRAIKKGIKELKRKGYLDPLPMTFVITNKDNVYTLPFDFSDYDSKETAMAEFSKLVIGFKPKGSMLLFTVLRRRVQGGKATPFRDGLFVYCEHKGGSFAVFQSFSFTDTSKIKLGEKIVYDENMEGALTLLSEVSHHFEFNQIDYEASAIF